MYRLFYLLETPLERALRMSAMTCGELAEYETQEFLRSKSQGGAFYFPRWGRRVFEFSALSFADGEKREAFLAVMERASHPFFAEEETQRRFRATAPRMAGPAAIQAAIRFYRREVERMYRSFSFDEYVAHLRKRYAQWKGGRVLESDMDDPRLVRLADPEFEMVDLVRLMKTDWQRTALVFCRE